MICAISPSNNNYEESLSTLRYADQAKKIQCNAVINESETDKKIRELKNENDELKKMIAQLRTGNFAGISSINLDQDTADLMNNSENFEKKIKELEEMLKGKNQLMNDMEKSFDMKLKESKDKVNVKVENNYNVPHLTNLNEDSLLSGKIYHNLEQIKVLYVGRKNSEPTPHIILQSIGIQPNHARIEKRSDGYFIVPACPAACEFIFLNGQNVNEPTKLENFDRLIFGIGSLFIFHDPQNPSAPRGNLSANEIDWENCQRELTSQHQHFSVGAADPAEEKRKQEKLKQIEEEYERMNKAHEEQLKNLELEHKSKMQEIVNQMSVHSADKEEVIQNEIKNFELLKEEFDKSFNQKIELEKNKKEEITKEFLKTFQEKDTKKLELKMNKIFPNIVETNLIASELKRNIVFSIHISYFYIDIDNIKNYEKQKKYRIKVKVDNNELGYSYFWDLRKFTSRYFMIKELAEKMSEGGPVEEYDQEKDPFWDPPEYQKVGEGFLKLMSLVYLTDNPNELILVGDNGKSGLLNVDIVPTNADGEPLEPDDPIFDDFIDNPNDLKGKDIYFNVVIGEGKLPPKLCTDSFVKYNLKLFNENQELVDVTFKTDKISGSNPEPDYKYKKLLCYKNFNDEAIKYLLKNNVNFEVFAFPEREVVQQAPMLRLSKVPTPAPSTPTLIKSSEPPRSNLQQSILVPDVSSKKAAPPTSPNVAKKPLHNDAEDRKREKEKPKAEKKACEIF